jgi:hypothetical protein
MVAEAWSNVQSKVNVSLLEKVRFEQLAEGMCVQFLHIGPYEGMDAALEKMLTVAREQGYSARTRNSHDIYLNDVRKTRSENLKAVIRLPVIRN